jgi:hypothetical protein
MEITDTQCLYMHYSLGYQLLASLFIHGTFILITGVIYRI